MELSIIQPRQEANPAKIAALICCVIVVGLLAASLFSAGPARAGGKSIPHTVSLSR